jgi:hypothetical protein
VRHHRHTASSSGRLLEAAPAALPPVTRVRQRRSFAAGGHRGLTRRAISRRGTSGGASRRRTWRSFAAARPRRSPRRPAATQACSRARARRA